MPILAIRMWGFAIFAACIAIAAVESGLIVHVDAVLPGWDKPVHALCVFGLVLILTPQPRRRRGVVAAIAAGIAWELAQFFFDPLQGHTPELWALDTATDLAADLAGAVLAMRAAPRPIMRWVE